MDTAAASDDLKKRKLPLWMLGVSAADNLNKTLDLDIFYKKDAHILRKCNKSSSEKEACLPNEETLEVEEPSVLLKCQMMTRKGEASRRDDCSSDHDTEVLHVKKKLSGVGRKIEEPIPLKRRRRRKEYRLGYENDDDIQVSSPGDNSDDDLTMEDLMSIAKEYVKDDNYKGQQQQSGEALSTISHSANVAREYGLDVKKSSVIVKCGMKGLKKEVSRPDVSSYANVKDIGSAMRKRSRVRNKVDKPVPSKWKTNTSGFKCNGDVDVWSPHNDDEDLTMDDLISIAKEFVDDDNDEHQKQLDGVRKADNRAVDTAFYNISETTGDSTIDSQIIRRPTQQEAVSRHSSTNNMKITTIIDKPIMTGDPAQDMLDLFLGPLLRKPVCQEKKSIVVSGDITFLHEEKKQNENLVNAPAPLTKKKSSLKDKVAMFLD